MIEIGDSTINVKTNLGNVTKSLQSYRLAKGGEVAEKSFVVLLLVGVVEVFVGIFSLSLALVADGVQSFADALVSLIVWIGLRLSGRAPDGKFHFGYYRVENFSSIIAAFVLTISGGIILYESYQGLLNPREIVNAELAMATALVATAIAGVILFFKARNARRYDSLAIKADAFNSIRDVLTSVTAFVAIALSKYLNIRATDSVAGIIIALFVFTVAYSVIKESSLVLMDACQCTDIVSDIEKIAKSVKHVKGVHGIRMRKLGPYLVGDMHIVVDGDMSVREADKVATQVEEEVKKEFDEVTEIKVRIEPPELSDKEQKQRGQD
ncbi:MAG TPA: cation diffusion facilitator family transporter [Acidobacteriota bacterium]|jgi:cation diffusion facilitator family transporter|nr:cation diffusion facilitator family transporter [Acidobacteriota bacterium]